MSSAYSQSRASRRSSAGHSVMPSAHSQSGASRRSPAGHSVMPSAHSQSRASRRSSADHSVMPSAHSQSRASRHSSAGHSVMPSAHRPITCPSDATCQPTSQSHAPQTPSLSPPSIMPAAPDTTFQTLVSRAQRHPSMMRYLMVSIGPSWWEYIEFASSAGFRDTSADPKVGRCRLTLSNQR